MTVVLAVGLMIGDGCAAFMGLNMGQGKTAKAAHGVGNAIILTIGFGIIFTILCEIFLEPLCWMFGATEQSIEYCLDYGRPIILGFTFLAIDMAFTPIIRADGRANVSLIGMVIGCVTNVILDPIFIFVFKWGVAGAAWATIAGQFLNAVYFIFCILKCNTVKLEKKHFDFHTAKTQSINIYHNISPHKTVISHIPFLCGFRICPEFHIRRQNIQVLSHSRVSYRRVLLTLFQARYCHLKH